MQQLDDTDFAHLRRAVDLAREALEAGDAPFGSVLVDAEGEVRFEDRNRVKDGDRTRHPELAAARWAVANLAPQERAGATVYTSGEHCPMCSAAHVLVGLGPIVYASSSAQLAGWFETWGVAGSGVAMLPINAIAPDVSATGPVDEFEDEIKDLQHRRHHP